jgi:hypothetical protein
METHIEVDVEPVRRRQPKKTLNTWLSDKDFFYRGEVPFNMLGCPHRAKSIAKVYACGDGHRTLPVKRPQLRFYI